MDQMLLIKTPIYLFLLIIIIHFSESILYEIRDLLDFLSAFTAIALELF